MARQTDWSDSCSVVKQTSEEGGDKAKAMTRTQNNTEHKNENEYHDRMSKEIRKHGT